MVDSKKLVLKYWLPVILWMGAIFSLSSIPGEFIPQVGIPNIDKLVHFGEYFILGILLVRAFLNSRFNMNLTAIIIVSIAAASLYAATDEWHQNFIPNRIPDIFDFLSDFIGVNMGVLIYRRYSAR